MHQSRLLKLLRTFSPQERWRLRLFVASPYFSHGERADQLIALLDFCLASLEKDPASAPAKEEAYEALFPGEMPVPGKLEKRMSALHRLLLQFLVSEQYFKQENQPDHQIVLAQEFRRRGFPTRSGAALRDARNFLEKTVHRDSVYYARKIKLTGLEANHAILQSHKATSIPYSQSFEALFIFYHSVRQDLAMSLHAMAHRFPIQRTALMTRMLDEEVIPDEFLQINPVLDFSNRYIKMLNHSEPDLDAFNSFVRDLKRQEHLLLPDEVKNCWTMARNQILNWWNSTKSKEWGSIYFSLALENAACGHLFYYGKILPHTMESICKTGLELGKFDIVYSFIDEHRGKISGETSDELFFTYFLAKYHRYAGNPEKALELLPATLPDNIFQLHAKILEIQILYELNSDLLPYRMDALRVFLHRSGPKLHPQERIIKVGRFLNYLMQLCRCAPGNMKRIGKIVTRIQTDSQTSEYHWLLEKAAALAASR